VSTIGNGSKVAENYDHTMGGKECPFIGSRSAITFPATSALSMLHNATVQRRAAHSQQALEG
jgi:hypothetical protein